MFRLFLTQERRRLSGSRRARWPRGLARGGALTAASLVLSLATDVSAQVETPPPASDPAAPAVPADPPDPAEAVSGKMTQAPELVRFVEAVQLAHSPPIERPTLVLFELTVQVDGSVADLVLVKGAHPVLDDAARQAVSQFRFTPAEIDGQPSAVRIRYEYVFDPETSASPTPSASALPPTSTSSAGTSPASPAAAPVIFGRFTGRLLQSGTRRPIVGAEVALPELGLRTLTDGEGRFSFERVAPGRVKIVLSDAQHKTTQDEEEVREGEVTDVTYYAEQTGFGEDDLVAVARKEKKVVSRRELSIRELNTIPGSNGDVLKAMQNLPGVARTNGEIVVLRGESGGRVLVNGHPVISAFHFGGLRSTVGNGMIESLEVTPGNYEARYGSTTSGIIDIQTRRPAGDGLHGYAQIDLFDGSLFVEGPVSENATFALGGRRSYIDAILAVALSAEDKKTFATAPRYYDFQGTYDWQKGQHRLRANAFGAQDELVLQLSEPLESDPAIRGKLGSFQRWVTGQVLYDYRRSDKTQLSAGLSYLNGHFKLNVGDALNGEFTAHNVMLRSDVSHEVSPWLTARAGLSLITQYGDVAATAPRGSDEAQPPPTLATLDNLTVDTDLVTVNPAVYAALDLRAGDLLVVPAVRVEHFSRPNELAGYTLVQPRLSARLEVSEDTAVKVAAGMYSRNPELFQVHDGFGNSKLEPERSLHYSGGVEFRCDEGLSLDAVGFYKTFYHSLSSVDDPAVKLDNGGEGRAFGAEFLLKHDAGSRFYGWTAYTLSRSERKESGETTFRIFDFDQTHNLNVVAQYRLTPTWEIGARFRYVSGNPDTPVVAATYDSDADVYTPTYGPYNSIRDGAFHQLDVRVDKHWIFDTWKLTAYIDAQNVYNRENPEGTSFNFNFTESKPSTGSNLPFIPSFGVKGEF